MKLLLALGFILFSVPSLAQEQDGVFAMPPEQGGVHLVLKFGRGMNGMTGFSDTTAVIPMRSIESCEEQGKKAIKKHKKDINAHYWCIEGTR